MDIKNQAMDIQTEPLDLSTRATENPKRLFSVIDYKFLSGLNRHLLKLYERTNLLAGEEGLCLPARVNPKNILPCQVCLKTFDRPSLLKRHMRTHTGEKPHVCNVCSKGFSTSSSLNTHRRIHTGEKPHKCPECGKCFTASSNLYYHRMTHTKNKPHKCPVCPRSFPTPGELRAHRPSHWAMAGALTCPLCARVFTRRPALAQHLRQHASMDFQNMGSMLTNVILPP